MTHLVLRWHVLDRTIISLKNCHYIQFKIGDRQLEGNFEKDSFEILCLRALVLFGRQECEHSLNELRSKDEISSE